MTYTHTHTHTHLFPPFTHCRLHVCFLCIADDEWICVRSGKVVLSQEGVADVEVPAGETVHIAPGTRFQPSFPVDTEYVPVCLPAFRPDRCIREEESGGAVSQRLEKLHAKRPRAEELAPEVLYHMTTSARWEEAKRTGSACACCHTKSRKLRRAL